MEFKYCPYCGKKLILKDSWDEGKVPYCDVHDEMFFDTPKPCVVVAVVKDDDILLLKQSYIFENSKVLLSGYVGQNEYIEETVVREVREESGLGVNNVQYLGSDYIENSDIVMITFMADYFEGEIKKSSEVEEIGWVPLNKALDQMKEDRIGSKVVNHIMEIKKK